MGNYCQSDPVTPQAARRGEMNATILRDEAISIMRRSARSQVLAAPQSASREAAVVSRLRQLLLFPHLVHTIQGASSPRKRQPSSEGSSCEERCFHLICSWLCSPTWQKAIIDVIQSLWTQHRTTD